MRAENLVVWLVVGMLADELAMLGIDEVGEEWME
jgi:hypothetical protein